MYYARIQPRCASLAGRVLFLLMCGVGWAGITGVWAGQTTVRTPPPANPAKPPTPPPSTKDIRREAPLGISGKSTTPGKVVGAEPLKTTTRRVLPPAAGRTGRTPISTLPPANNVRVVNPPSPPRVIHNPPSLGMPDKPPREGPAGGIVAGPVKTAPLKNPPIAAGRRDPFKAFVVPSAVVSRSLPAAGALPAGTRGLVISSLQLQGVVRQEPANNMIAVVTNSTKRAYFLRVNDTVYNGVVSKITPEAIYFTENTLDSRGQAATHEVEIKLGPAPGEGR